MPDRKVPSGLPQSGSGSDRSGRGVGRGDLLAVVHAFPGSSVKDGMVELVVPGQPSDRIEELARTALALARTLDRTASRSSTSDKQRQPRKLTT